MYVYVYAYVYVYVYVCPGYDVKLRPAVGDVTLSGDRHLPRHLVVVISLMGSSEDWLTLLCI